MRDRYNEYGRKPSPSRYSSDDLRNTSVGFLLLDFCTFFRRHDHPFWAKTNESSDFKSSTIR